MGGGCKEGSWENGKLKMENGKRKMENGKRKTENGKWKTRIPLMANRD